MLTNDPIIQPKIDSLRYLLTSFTDSPYFAAIEKLLLVSDYAVKHVKILQALIVNHNFLTKFDYWHLTQSLPHQPFSQFSATLREFRHYHFLALLLRESNHVATVEDTLLNWSRCADAIIIRAFTYCIEELARRFGKPQDEEGRPVFLSVLAMGKLGGNELNFSSDIDLILVYSRTGFTNGAESISNHEFFVKTAQLFIELMQTTTIHGFVFRVDLRLRPNGISGALVSSIAGLEIYYQEQGRDWERYAMIKARLIPIQHNNVSWFERLIIPFTYRRYIDFSVIESLRSMKALIEQEVLQNPNLNDIKRGLGGIREVEFIIQSIQLIRGGRLPSLRCQSALQVMNIIQQEELLPQVNQLKQAYLFLRQLENCLQSLNDQQTHSLPESSIKQVQICYAMNFNNWSELTAKLTYHQTLVRNVFTTILRSENHENEHDFLNHQLISVWQGNIEPLMAINLLSSLGFQNASRSYELISTFRHTPRCRRLNQTSRIRLDKFMGLLLFTLSKTEPSEQLLLDIIKLLEQIVGRSAYLALLSENPHVIGELLYWFANCPFIANLIVEQPFLLESLLTDEEWHPKSRVLLRQQLDKALENTEEIEQQLTILRQFKLTQWLLAAKAEILKQAPAFRIGEFLSDVAEVIVNSTVTLACQELAERYPSIGKLKQEFGIIAYGRLGSRDMNYSSDLDLVFIYSGNNDNESDVFRLTQKIIHMLTTRLQSGILYAVDTRLRPSGAAGLLVTSVNAFKDYQLTRAWTWEHQAIIRARLVYGKVRLKTQFKQLRQTLLSKKRPLKLLKTDFRDMLTKLIRLNETQSLKFSPGGTIDLDFLIQFLVLRNPEIKYPSTSSLKLLRNLREGNAITVAQHTLLKSLYCDYQVLMHTGVLKPAENANFEPLRKIVLKLKQGFKLGQ